jgi:hypothetical protein
VAQPGKADAACAEAAAARPDERLRHAGPRQLPPTHPPIPFCAGTAPKPTRPPLLKYHQTWSRGARTGGARRQQRRVTEAKHGRNGEGAGKGRKRAKRRAMRRTRRRVRVRRRARRRAIWTGTRRRIGRAAWTRQTRRPGALVERCRNGFRPLSQGNSGSR